MTRVFPSIALIDADPARRRRMESLASTMGVRGVSLAAMPTSEIPHQDIVLLVGGALQATILDARGAFPMARVIVAGTSSDQNEAVTAFRAGADDFVWLGAGDAELARVLARHMSLCHPAVDADAEDDAQDDGGLVGTSASIAHLRRFIRKLAPTRATVLITGETGTGKDVAAVLLHRLSRRGDKPLVALNCAAIPDALIEGELFGYERGAFSGAHTAYPGKLKLADGGTLLLDELGELSLAGQAKLLRAIETRESWRLGARAPTRFDARVIAVTNRDLSTEVRAGRFREDLFYRLAVSQLRMPPLRERSGDIALLAKHLLRQLGEEAGRSALCLDDAAIGCLEAHDWPGNVRELRNALEVATINAAGDIIRPADLPAHIGDRANGATGHRPIHLVDERAQLIAALDGANGNKSLAAQRLNCSRMTLYRRMGRHGLTEGSAVTL